MLAFQELEKRTGLKLDFRHYPEGQGTEQFNLMLASNDLADIIWYTWPRFPGGPARAIDDGVIIELGDLIKGYAPNFSQIMDEYPEVRRDSATDEGYFYEMPFLKVAKEDRVVGQFHIRQDWLDKLGLQRPTNMDEWYTVLKAFKEKDPNGNGKADEIPFISISQGNIHGVERFTYAWGFPTDFYVDNRQVKYGPAQPDYKTYLATMAKWYREGLIDPEFLITDRKTHDSMVTTGTAGAYYGLLNGFMGTYIGVMEKLDPKFNLQGTVNPIAPDGKMYDFYVDDVKIVQNSGMAISVQNKYPVETIKMLDYFYGEEGRILMNLGVEGLTYKVVNGEFIYTDLILNNPDGLSLAESISKYCPVGACRLWQDTRYFSQIIPYPAQKEAAVLLTKATTERALPPLTPSQDEASRLVNIQNEITNYFREMFAKFIMGQEDVEKGFDTYINTLNSLGLPEALEIYQRALERYYKR
jgi:putative aldouronate transport system substrate-binding protein